MAAFADILKNIGDFERGQGGALQFMGTTHYERDGRPGEKLATVWGPRESVKEPGYRPLGLTRPEMKRIYEQRLMAAADLVHRAFHGTKRDMVNLEEAMSTSDFPALFGDIIDRSVLANYRETPYTWNLIANRKVCQDFRQVRRIRVDYGSGLLGGTAANSGALTAIEQGGPYAEQKLADASYTYRLQKYGNRMPFFWETMINDDLDALKDTPARFGRGTRRSEEYFVTNLFANNTSFFTTANKNVVKSSVLGAAPSSSFANPTLSITGLQNALLVMSSQVDLDLQPISVEAVTLVVPPALEVTARNILNATQIWMNDFGGTTAASGSGATATLSNAQRLLAENWMRGRVNIAVNYQLPLIDTTYGSTGWYLFANPQDRPAVEFGLLRGHEMPELFMKSPNSIAIGEGNMGPGGSMPGTGLANPMEGDFDTDAIHYKIRHVFGGSTLDPKMAVFSNGSGA